MRTDETLAQLALENPVRERDLADPRSAEAQALVERVVLEDAPRRGGGARRGRARRRVLGGRRLAWRAAFAGAAAAVVALAVTGALSGDGGLPGDGPEQASAVERAAAALSVSGDDILHTVELKTTKTAEGTETSSVEAWQQLSPPYDHRQVQERGGRVHEFANADGRPQIYDSSSNEIATLAPGVKPPEGGFPPPPTGPPWLDRLEGGRPAPLQPFTGLRDQILPLLRSGKVREAGRTTVDGREAIRIVNRSLNIDILVDAHTYLPIQWTIEFEAPTGVETTRLTTFERLPATEANFAKLDLRAQHPDAKLNPGGITMDPDPAGK